MAKRTYTPEQRAEALDLYRTDGPTAVDQRMGIPKQTVQDWAKAAGVRTIRTETTAAAVEAHQADLAQRRAQLASDLMGDIERLRSQFFAPVVERKVVVADKNPEIVDVHLTQPTFSDQKAIATSCAILVDKVQVLTGESNLRVEHRHVDAVDAQLEQLAAQLEAAHG